MIIKTWIYFNFISGSDRFSSSDPVQVEIFRVVDPWKLFCRVRVCLLVDEIFLASSDRIADWFQMEFSGYRRVQSDPRRTLGPINTPSFFNDDLF